MSSFVSPALKALLSGASIVAIRCCLGIVRLRSASLECSFEDSGLKLDCLMLLVWSLLVVVEERTRSKRKCEDGRCCVCLS